MFLLANSPSFGGRWIKWTNFKRRGLESNEPRHKPRRAFKKNVGSQNNETCCIFLFIHVENQKTKKGANNGLLELSAIYSILCGQALSTDFQNKTSLGISTVHVRSQRFGPQFQAGSTQDANHKWRFGLGFPNLKMVHNPDGDWHPGWGVDPTYTKNEQNQNYIIISDRVPLFKFETRLPSQKQDRTCPKAPMK